MNQRTAATRPLKPEQLRERPYQGGAMLLVIAGPLLGQRIELGVREMTIGRSREAGFRIPHEGVSRLHCRIVLRADGYRLLDLGSTNKTLLNGTVIEDAVLRDGDRIKLGDTVLKFFDHGSLESDYQQALVERAAFDDLTQLYNRRQFLQHLHEEVERAEGKSEALALLLLDIDHFKPVNDTHGHLAGDAVLRGIARILRESLPPQAEAGRLGGEEFGVLLRACLLDDALAYAETLRQAIAEMRVDVGAGEAIGVTTSIGAACWQPGFKGATDLLRAADVALYAAKDAGRNRVERG